MTTLAAIHSNWHSATGCYVRDLHLPHGEWPWRLITATPLSLTSAGPG